MGTFPPYGRANFPLPKAPFLPIVKGKLCPSTEGQIVSPNQRANFLQVPNIKNFRALRTLFLLQNFPLRPFPSPKNRPSPSIFGMFFWFQNVLVFKAKKLCFSAFLNSPADSQIAQSVKILFLKYKNYPKTHLRASEIIFVFWVPLWNSRKQQMIGFARAAGVNKVDLKNLLQWRLIYHIRGGAVTIDKKMKLRAVLVTWITVLCLVQCFLNKST